MFSMTALVSGLDGWTISLLLAPLTCIRPEGLIGLVDPVGLVDPMELAGCVEWFVKSLCTLRLEALSDLVLLRDLNPSRVLGLLLNGPRNDLAPVLFGLLMVGRALAGLLEILVTFTMLANGILWAPLLSTLPFPCRCPL